jgi:hypothetical protein
MSDKELSVACPHCKAKAGAACRPPSGGRYTNFYHGARSRAVDEKPKELVWPKQQPLPFADYDGEVMVSTLVFTVEYVVPVDEEDAIARLDEALIALQCVGSAAVVRRRALGMKFEDACRVLDKRARR